MNIFTQEQLEQAKLVSLTEVAKKCGYTVIKKGNHYSLKEMDSVIIFNDRTWYRYSENCGGSQIDFLTKFAGLSFLEAVKTLLDMNGFILKYESSKNAIENTSKEMKLPTPVEGNYKFAFAYLIQKRKLNIKTIQYFIDNKLLYEEAAHHNLVFIGYDKDKAIKYATKHGTNDSNGKCFKGDVEGNNKAYGVNIRNIKSNELNVFEAAIDMMSFCQLNNDYDKTNKVALGMLFDKPLETFLEENKQISKINFYLDNDVPGRRAALDYVKKYSDLKYEITDNVMPEGKDVNEYLIIINSPQKGIQKSIQNKPQKHGL